MPRPVDPNKFAKARNPVATIKRLLSFLKDKIPIIIFVLSLTAISSVISVISAGYISDIIDVGIVPMIGNITSEGMKIFITLLVKLAIFYLISIVISYVSSILMNRVCNKTLNKIRNMLFAKMQELPISYFDRHTHGELMSYFTNDVGAIREAVGDTLTTVLEGVITLVGTFIKMFIISPLMTIAIIVLFLVMTVITKFIGGKSIVNFKQQQDATAKLNGYMEEMMTGQKVVKVFTHEDETKDEFNQINETARRASTRANIFSGIMGPISNNLSYVNYAVCSIIGCWLVINNVITVGKLAEFLTRSNQFARPLNRIMQQFNGLTRAVAGAERIFDVLDTPAEEDEGKVVLVNASYNEDNQLIEVEEHTGLWAWKKEDGTLVRLRGDVKFTDVDFSYDGKKQVLNDVTFYAKPGQKIAFVGATGAGKTTITNLINRFYDITDGTILYDGIDIKDIKKASLRSSMAFVLQDTHLFTGTVMDNIRYGRLSATDEQIIEAAKLANADEFITMLPEGYNTVLTEDGANLSQGQRQLLSIARAAVADAPLLVLDEATSSVDTRTEKLIEKGMDNLMAGRTVFVIAHRLSTVRNSNAIMVLDKGEIIERGDHDELIGQKGQYYRLYTGQFELD